MSSEETKPEESKNAETAGAAGNQSTDAVMTDAAKSISAKTLYMAKGETSQPDKPAGTEKEEEEIPKKEDISADNGLPEDLPKNRFELELEFVQSLASPAYLHYLATNPSSDDHNWLDDPDFVEYLRYLLDVWQRPEYNRFLVYPQSLYFLEWMLNHRREEWAQIGFRNFAHQQQFHSWQHRASRLYGRGSTKPVLEPVENPQEQQQPPAGADPSVENGQPEAMKEG